MVDLENTDPNTVWSTLAEKQTTEPLKSVTDVTVIDTPIITDSTICSAEEVVEIQDTIMEVSDGDHDCREITLEEAGVSQAQPKTGSQVATSSTVPIPKSNEIRTPVKNTKSKLKHFKRSRIQLPPKTNTNFESHPAYITLLAEYYKTLELSPSLLACLVQDQSGERPALLKSLVKKLSSTTKFTEDQTNFVNSFLDSSCQRVNYGLIDNMNTNYHVFRWEVKLELIPDELRAEVQKKRLEKAKVKQDIINYYNDLETAEKIELKLNDINPFANSDAVASDIVPLPVVQGQETLDVDAQQCKENNTPAKATKKERKRKSTDTPKIPKEKPTPKSQKKLKMEKNQPTLSNFFKPISRPLEAPALVANTKLNFAPFNLKSGVQLASENLFFHLVNGDAWLSSMDSCSKETSKQL